MAKNKRVVSKSELYGVMANLNQNMESILVNIQSLLSIGVRRELVTVYEDKIEELRSWINSEILEVHFERELRDWAKFGKRVRDWERCDRNPGDENPTASVPSQPKSSFADPAGKGRRQIVAS